ncbi:MAG TPA: glycosyltransferase family 4 protein [Acidobacteriaceae bacterium]|nr:glycosyltransferase family 4 protein [Acidobacteriaceae bacterium]
MRIAISTTRQAHYKLPANSFVRRGNDVTIYSSTPVRRFRGFDRSLQHRFVPAPVTLFNALTRIGPPVWMNELDTALYDLFVSLRIGEYDLFLGGASGSLYTGKAIQRNGGTFVLDRACPHIRFQQELLVEEAKKAGGVFRRQTPWFLDRQVEEYEQADFLLMPSNYSINTYPEHIRQKTILAPLCARVGVSPRTPKPAGSPFIVGVVGGQPLRKGYLYLLQAWKELALPNAQLKIRSGPAYRKFPILAQLVADQPNVEFLSYIPDIGAFYSQCDIFILPSVDDGFGMALFEAMAKGVPSIATHSTGASELLVNGRDAVLIDAGSVQQIKEAIATLYESREMRERLGRNGQATISSLMEGDMAKPYIEGIDRLLQVAEQKSAVPAR